MALPVASRVRQGLCQTGIVYIAIIFIIVVSNYLHLALSGLMLIVLTRRI